MIKEVIRKIKEMTFLKQTFLIVGVLFFSFSCLFPAGGFNKLTENEYLAEYASNIVNDHTKSKEYASLIVESKDSNKYQPLPTEIEFHNLFGVFGENKANYVGAVNADKRHSIFFKDILEDVNLSFIYIQNAGFNNVEYNGAWKHEYYPLQLMFKGKHFFEDAFSFLYISQSQADLFLNKLGLEKNESNYESLIGTKIVILFDNIEYVWAIANIYLETNYFYDAIYDVMGNFVFGYNKYPNGINKQALYFLREHNFQNKYYFTYVKSQYPMENYSYKIGTYNIFDNFEVNNDLLIKAPFVNNTVSCLLFAFSIIGIVLSCVFMYLVRYPKKIINIFPLLAGLLVPYLIFYLIYFIKHNIFVFSYLSLSFYIILVLLVSSFFLIVFILNRRKRML